MNHTPDYKFREKAWATTRQLTRLLGGSDAYELWLIQAFPYTYSSAAFPSWERLYHAQKEEIARLREAQWAKTMEVCE